MKASLHRHTSTKVRHEAGRFPPEPSLHEQLAEANELAFENPMRAIRAFESGKTRASTSAPVGPKPAVLHS